MACRSLLVLILLAGQVALAPLAHASPPDQTWIVGLYDAADYDDVVVAATSADTTWESPPVILLSALLSLVGVVLLASGASMPAVALQAFQIRAPPTR